MGLEDMMDRLKTGLPGKKPASQGPLGDAVEVLKGVVYELEAAGHDNTATAKAVKVVLEHLTIQREALQAAVDLVNCFEASLGEEWSEKRAGLITALIQKFKLKAVSARMHQTIPQTEGTA